MLLIDEGRNKAYRAVCFLMALAFGLYFAAMTFTQGGVLANRFAVTVQLTALTLLCAYGVWAVGRRAMTWQPLCRRALWLLGGLGILWTQWTLVCCLYGEFGWDVFQCMEAGMNLVDVGEGVNYLTVYPNNMLLSVFYGNLFWLGQDLGLYDNMVLLIWLNLFMVDMSVAVGAVMARRTLGRGAAGAYLILCAPLVLFNPWISVPYSDTLTLLAPVLTLYLWDRARQTTLGKALIYWALMGLAVGVSFMIKPTVAISLAAVGILGFFLVNKKWQSWLKHILGLVLAVAIAIGVTQGAYLYCYSLAPAELNHETIEESSFPMTHFFMMGLNELDGRYGAWNYGDVSFTQNIPGKAAKEAANLQEAARRISEMGVGGYLDFLWKKSQFTWNDGTFWYGKEGSFCPLYSFEDDVSVAVRSLFLPDDQPARPLYESWANGVWILALGLMALGTLKKGQPPLLWAARLTVLGLALFQLLFETRGRYLVNHLPVILLMAAVGLKTLGQIPQGLQKLRACK